jgi:hypothetical protein
MWLPCNNIFNCNISLQPNSPRLNHKMFQTFFFKFWFWDWLHKISLQPNSTKLLFLCSWIKKCSKSSSSSSSSSNSGFRDDYQKSLSNWIPPNFCFYVPKSQNVPNLLHMFLFSGTTYWAVVKVLWIIHIHHSQKFWCILGAKAGVSFQLSKSLQRHVIPHPHPTRLQIKLCPTLVSLVFLHIIVECMSWQMTSPTKGWQRHY